MRHLSEGRENEMTKTTQQAIREAVAMELEWVAKVFEPEFKDQEKWKWLLAKAESIRKGIELSRWQLWQKGL